MEEVLASLADGHELALFQIGIICSLLLGIFYTKVFLGEHLATRKETYQYPYVWHVYQGFRAGICSLTGWGVMVILYHNLSATEWSFEQVGLVHLITLLIGLLGITGLLPFLLENILTSLKGLQETVTRLLGK